MNNLYQKIASRRILIGNYHSQSSALPSRMEDNKNNSYRNNIPVVEKNELFTQYSKRLFLG